MEAIQAHMQKNDRHGHLCAVRVCVDAGAAEKSSDKAEDAAEAQYKWLRKAGHIRSTQEVNSGAGCGGGEVIT